ncbi:Crp/Fnr family transcriptional regulator [Aquincola sp. S2]|uniref:Crp/Fnr family transcriptional regulator n=1 Tax=Pseudaquabacterium terrae TaxID=2732868 RepID=A0ABX2ELJ9_9BURK|nr:Crp/Fnr family transcriptional regulator [Aquabacterium terrae]NRF69529.1 Crp/Fnr family transcriptional regulator [Aquabacterium terrae]
MPGLDTCLRALLGANFPELPLDTAAAAAALGAALPHCRLKRLSPGATLFAQGAPAAALYGVIDGELALRFGAVDGAVSTIELAARHRLFGLAAFAGGMPSSYEAVAHRASQVLVIGRAGYELLMDGLPGFGRALMREFAQRHDGALRLLQASRLQSASERLSLALTHLRDHAGRAEAPAPDGSVLLRTTQAELAALAGLSRQTVNEWLQRMAAQGRLQPVYGGIRLLT